MGKEQELLDAARNGNIAVIEKLLGRGGKKGTAQILVKGVLDTLRKALSPDCKDSNGDTPLHLAALNGHRDVVSSLLTHGAKPNITDSRGCNALHLAAWNGHADICSDLLSYDGGLVSVNFQNTQGETALLLASQYGHSQVVQVLLKHKADPRITNHTGEGPLDVACLYGRLESVEWLLKNCPDLVNDSRDTSIREFSPLHYASKNGHFQVVQLLLESGYNINVKTEHGTALHEAAIYGKDDVVEYLLEEGIDVYLTDSASRTALEVLSDQKSQRSLNIGKAILEHLQKVGLSPTKARPASTGSFIEDTFHPEPSPSQLNTSRESTSSYHSQKAVGGSPFPRISLSNAGDLPRLSTGDDVQDDGDYDPIYDVPQPTVVVYQIAANTSNPSDSTQAECTDSDDALTPAETLLSSTPPKTKPGAPQKPPRRHLTSKVPQFDTSPQCFAQSDSGVQHSTVLGIMEEEPATTPEENQPTIDPHDQSTHRSVRHSSSSSVHAGQKDGPIETTTSLHAKETTIQPEKARDDAQVAMRTSQVARHSFAASRYSGQKDSLDVAIPAAPGESIDIGGEILDSNQSNNNNIAAGQNKLLPCAYPGHCAGTSPLQLSASSTDSRPSSLELRESDVCRAVSKKPSGVEDTPDFPPPSPATARQGIQCALSVEKRRSRDMETNTDDLLIAHTCDAQTGTSNSPVLRRPQRPNPAASSEDLLTNDKEPFLGLTKGSLLPGQPRAKSQIYGNVIVHPAARKRMSLLEGDMDSHNGKKEVKQWSRSDAPCVEVESDGQKTLDESKEWAEIADIMASFGGGIARESVFISECQANFTRMLSSETAHLVSVGDWLESIALPQYENVLIAHGFDNMEFMGSNVLEYQDLIEMGITTASHITAILGSSSKIPPVKYIGDAPVPATVKDWLDSLDIPSYLDTFLANGFFSVQQLQRVWELELSSVLDIPLLGHQKRVLASLRCPYKSVSRDGGRQQSMDKKLRFSTYSPAFNPHSLESFLREQTPPQPEPVYNTAESRPSCSSDVFEDDLQVEIRPPTGTHVDQWHHRPEVLIKGCCNYNVQYLGSTLVKQLVGLESTKDSIARLKKSSANVLKIPTIQLSISYKGVKFIDGRSKQVICEHEISNIFCACQDGLNLRFFAYITRDLQTEQHYCHVFCTKSKEIATEVILTLGEAFEIAYQLAIREQRQDPNKPKGCHDSDA